MHPGTASPAGWIDRIEECREHRDEPDPANGTASAGPARVDSGVRTGDGGPPRIPPLLVASGPSSLRRVAGGPPCRSPRAGRGLTPVRPPRAQVLSTRVNAASASFGRPAVRVAGS